MSTALLPTTDRALTRRLAVEQSQGRVPSLVAALIRDGETIWFGSRGEVAGAPATADTQYRIGSITKSMVAVLVMRLRDEGLLDLSDSVDTYVPGTAIGNRSIEKLLSHSSGLSAEPHGPWWERTPGTGSEEFLANIDPDAVRPNPRHTFHYSNTGFGLLGELVSRVRGVHWSKVLRAELLEPLGMTRTDLSPSAPHAVGWAVHPWADVLHPEPAEDAGAMAPAGQLWSTVDDMARWLRFLTGDTADVLHPDTVAEMRAPATVDDGDQWRNGMGLGLQLLRHGGRRLAGHTGSMPGFLATVYADPAEKTGVVFMGNSTAGVRGVLIPDLLDILEQHEPYIPETWRPTSEVSAEVLAMTGQWFWGPTPYALRVLPDGLLDLVPWNGMGRASRFRANGDGTWTGLDGYYAGEPLTVGRDSAGAVTHLDVKTFLFTRTPYDQAAPVPGGARTWRSGPDLASE